MLSRSGTDDQQLASSLASPSRDRDERRRLMTRESAEPTRQALRASPGLRHVFRIKQLLYIS
jgi:hypothetical protein